MSPSHFDTQPIILVVCSEITSESAMALCVTSLQRFISRIIAHPVSLVKGGLLQQRGAIPVLYACGILVMKMF